VGLNWYPFRRQLEFELADFMYHTTQLPESRIDELMDLWAADVLENGRGPPFANTDDLHHVIDAIPHGEIPWESFSLRYRKKDGESTMPWMDKEWEVWFRDPKLVARSLLESLPIDVAPYRETRDAGTSLISAFIRKLT
jgi:hypothetical protein